MLVGVVFSALLVSAQNYGVLNTVGTEAPYTYNSTGNAILTAPSSEVLSSAQTIPFTFEYYGQNVFSYKASDNGYITFNTASTTSESVNTTIPAVGGPNNAIYAFWDDLDIAVGSGSVDEVRTFTYGTAPNRVHVIQWFSVTPVGGSGFLYAAIRLYECGDFDIVHNYGNATGLTATVGCENSSGSLGTQIVGSPTMDYPALTAPETDDIVYTFLWEGINYDMSVQSVDLSGMILVGTHTVTGTIVNYGVNTITSFDLNYTVNGGPVNTSTIVANLPLGASYNYAHSTPLDLTIGGQAVELCVWADNLNGGNIDERQCNDQICNDLYSNLGISGTRTVLLEEFTGSWCGWCPDGAVIMDDIIAANPNDVVVVSIHDGDDMEFADGIRSGFGVSAYPNGMVDRKVFAGEADEPHSRGQWALNAQAQIGSYTPADVSFVHSYDPATREIVLVVTGNFVDYASGDMRLGAMIVEDNVTGTGSGYDQVNYYNTTVGHPFEGVGDPIIGYAHNHVLRALPGGTYGVAGTIPALASPGEVYTETMTYSLPIEFDETNIRLVGFMAYQSANIGEREIIDVAQMDLAYLGNLGLVELDQTNNIRVYPNPASEVVNFEIILNETSNTQISIYDMYGKLIKTVTNEVLTSGTQRVSYDTNQLANGVYIAEVTISGRKQTMRFMVK